MQKPNPCITAGQARNLAAQAKSAAKKQKRLAKQTTRIKAMESCEEKNGAEYEQVAK